MKKMQKIVCLILVLIMAGTLFGCAQELATMEENYPPLADSPDEGGDEADEAAPAAPAAPEPKVEKKAEPPAEKKSEEPKPAEETKTTESEPKTVEEPKAAEEPKTEAEPKNDEPAAPSSEPAGEPAADNGVSTISEPGQPLDTPAPSAAPAASSKAPEEKEPVYVTMHCTRGTVDGVDSFVITLADGKLSTGHEPKCEGYAFAGWYKEQDGTGSYTDIPSGTKYAYGDDIPEGVKDLYAYWTVVTPEPVEVTPDPDKMLETGPTQNNYTVGVWLHAFNSNFVEESKKNQASVWVEFKEGTRELPDALPEVASSNGKFLGWYTEAPSVKEVQSPKGFTYRVLDHANGVKVNPGGAVPQDVWVLYAVFEYSEPAEESAAGKYVTFKLSWNGMFGMNTAMTCSRGYDGNNGAPKFTAADAAVFGLNYQASFDAKYEQLGKGWDALRTIWSENTFNGYQFLGWSAEQHGSGSLIWQDTEVTDGMTFYAQWKKVGSDSDNSDNFIAPTEAPAGPLEAMRIDGALTQRAHKGDTLKVQLFTTPVKTDLTKKNNVNELTWYVTTTDAKGAQRKMPVTISGASLNAYNVTASVSADKRTLTLKYDGSEDRVFTISAEAVTIGNSKITTGGSATLSYGHDWVEQSRTAEPTCTTGQDIIYKCSIDGCSETKKEHIAPLEHVYESRSDKGYKVTKEPTCTEPGEKVLICLRCGAEKPGAKPVAIPATGHDYQASSKTRSISLDGSAGTQVCSHCGAVRYLAGWQDIDGKRYYYNNSGAAQTGWQTIGGKKYYLGTDGVMTTGWQTISGKKYYLGTDGVMTTGWQTISGKKYYLGTDGMMTTGWQTIGGKKYYLGNDGVMATGAARISGKTYLFNASGEILGSGWQTVNGKKYYLNADGTAKTGWQTISKKKYYLGTDGVMATGAVTVSGKIYVLNASGQLLGSGWQTVDGKKYYLDKNGVAKTGWQKISSKYYYLGTDGVMRTGWQDVSGKRYYLDSKGVRKTGWQTIEGKKYYFNSSGVMLTGKQKISKKYYYLGADGAALTGWQTIDGKKVYLNASGQILTGWQTIGGKKYYLNSDGTYKTGVQKISKKYYYFDGSGVMQTGWQTISGKKCWFDSKGVRKTGWVTISGKKYYFNSSGEMLTGLQKISKKYYYLGTDGVMRTGWQDINGSRYYFKSNGQAATGKYKISGKTYKFSSSGVLQS